MNKREILKSQRGMDQIVEEIRMHNALHQCNSILQLEKIFETPDNIYLMLEYQEGGDLVKLIQRRKKLTEEDTGTIMSQLLLSVDFMH
jgi:serine/threonine protein kinase